MAKRACRIFSLNIILFITQISYAQEIDSLLNLAGQTLDKKRQVDLYNSISEKCGYINYDSSMHYAEKAYKIAITINYKEGEITALRLKSIYYLHSGENIMAHDLLKQAEKIAESIGDKVLLAQVYMNIGDVFSNTILFDKAFEYFSNAIDIFKKNEEYDDYYSCLNRMGVLHAKSNNYDEAMNMFNEVLEETSTEKYYMSYIGVLNNIATLKKIQGDYKGALEVYKKVLKANMQRRNFKFATGNLGNISFTYLNLGDTTTALAYIDSSIYLGNRMNDQYQVTYSLLNKCKILIIQNKLDSVEEPLLKAFNTSVESNWPDYAMESAQYISEYYSKIGDYKQANTYIHQYLKYRESVESEGNTQRLAELKFRYDYEKENMMLEAKRRRMSILIKALSVLILMSVTLIIILIIQRKTKLAKIRLQQENLELETEKLNLKQENLKNQLELRNKEITSSIILLQKKNDLLVSVANKLSQAKAQFTKANWVIIEKCIEELRESTDDTDWKNFDYYFNQVYESFYEKLNEINPNLTANDLKLCAYIKLRMSTKEIAALTNSTMRSVEVARYRLRKKLNITSSSTPINVFLDNL